MRTHLTSDTGQTSAPGWGTGQEQDATNRQLCPGTISRCTAPPPPPPRHTLQELGCRKSEEEDSATPCEACSVAFLYKVRKSTGWGAGGGGRGPTPIPAPGDPPPSRPLHIQPQHWKEQQCSPLTPPPPKTFMLRSCNSPPPPTSPSSTEAVESINSVHPPPPSPQNLHGVQSSNPDMHSRCREQQRPPHSGSRRQRHCATHSERGPRALHYIIRAQRARPPSIQGAERSNGPPHVLKSHNFASCLHYSQNTINSNIWMKSHWTHTPKENQNIMVINYMHIHVAPRLRLR